MILCETDKLCVNKKMEIQFLFISLKWSSVKPSSPMEMYTYIVFGEKRRHTIFITHIDDTSRFLPWKWLDLIWIAWLDGNGFCLCKIFSSDFLSAVISNQSLFDGKVLCMNWKIPLSISLLLHYVCWYGGKNPISMKLIMNVYVYAVCFGYRYFALFKYSIMCTTVIWRNNIGKKQQENIENTPI